MTVSTGIDVIEVGRIEKNIKKHGDRFLQRIYTDKEIEYCNSKNAQKYQSYAGRFAAKEATFKAISGFIKNKYELEWTDIEVLNNENGRPLVKVSSTIKEAVGNDIYIDISISHVKEVAVANALVIV